MIVIALIDLFLKQFPVELENRNLRLESHT